MGTVYVFVVGTRAQLVKMAPVMRDVARRGLPLRLLLTGQHLDSMAELARDLGVEELFPSDELEIEHATVGSLLSWFPKAFLDCRRKVKDLVARSGGAVVLVHGDTASTLLGAMVASSLRLPVAHVESGLSSNRILDPFPEELCRRLVFRMTTFAFCPNDVSTDRMRNFRGTQAFNTQGNTIADALALALSVPPDAEAEGFDLVVSIHRFENIRRRIRLGYIVNHILRVAESHRTAFVLHPSTVSKLHRFGLHQMLAKHPRITLMDRMPYSSFVRLVASARLIVSDGGSNQEEFSLMGVPMLVLRDRTERPDGLGRNIVLESDLGMSFGDYIIQGHAEKLRQPPSVITEPTVSSKIVDRLTQCLRDGSTMATARP